MPAVIPELGRRFREWLKFSRTRREGMRLYYKRYSQQLSKLETCIKAVQDTNKDYLKLKLAIRIARVQLDAGNLRGFGSRTSSVTGNSQNSKATLDRLSRMIPTPRAKAKAKAKQQPRRRRWENGHLVEEPLDEEQDEQEEEEEEWGERDDAYWADPEGEEAPDPEHVRHLPPQTGQN